LRREHESGADFVELANQLASSPQELDVRWPDGSLMHVHVDGLSLLDLAEESDQNRGIAAHLPAVVQSGLGGDLRPLARYVALADQTTPNDTSSEINWTVYLATTCNDLQTQSSPAQTGQFGSWAASFDDA
jgi:hypothetical protein